MEATGDAEIRRGEEVRALARGSAVTKDGSRVSADSFVIATGSRPIRPETPGSNKKGVLVLDSADAYRELAIALPDSSSAFIAGEGLEALEVASNVSKVTPTKALVGNLERALGVQPATASTIRGAAASMGAALLDTRLQRAVGLQKVEGIVFGDQVYACDLLVVVPRRVPTHPIIDAPLTSLGAISVDRNLASGMPSVFAAGGCAAMAESRSSRFLPLGADPRNSGRAAGRNASGLAERFTSWSSQTTDIFGLRLAKAGVDASDPIVLSGEAVPVTIVFGDRLACTVYHGRRSGRILGVEAVGEPSEVSGESARIVVSLSVSLSALAQCAIGSSTDISLLAETARQALKNWRGC